MDQIIYVGIGIFVLVLILSLTYQGYAQSQNQIVTQYCKAGTTYAQCVVGANDMGMGVVTNYTKYSGSMPNTFGASLQLAVFALVFIAVILAVVDALKGGSGAASGGFLGA